jgi:prefoldin alpha subunit
MSSKDKDEDQDLQTKVMQVRYLEGYLEDLANRENVAMSTLNDIQNAEDTIEELEKGKKLETMVYIGGGMYTPSKMGATKKVLVNVGQNVVVEKNLENAQTFLREKKSDIKDALNEIGQQKQQAAYTLQRLREDVEGTLRKRQSG